MNLEHFCEDISGEVWLRREDSLSQWVALSMGWTKSEFTSLLPGRWCSVTLPLSFLHNRLHTLLNRKPRGTWLPWRKPGNFFPGVAFIWSFVTAVKETAKVGGKRGLPLPKTVFFLSYPWPRVLMWVSKRKDFTRVTCLFCTDGGGRLFLPEKQGKSLAPLIFSLPQSFSIISVISGKWEITIFCFLSIKHWLAGCRSHLDYNLRESCLAVLHRRHINYSVRKHKFSSSALPLTSHIWLWVSKLFSLNLGFEWRLKDPPKRF